MKLAKSSLRDFGGWSMNLSVSMSGIPGLVISILFEKISTKGHAQVMEKS